MRVTQEGNLMEIYKATYDELAAITSAPLGCAGVVVNTGNWYMWNGTEWLLKGAI